MVADKEVMTICERMKQAVDLHTTTFSQYVISEFLKAKQLEKHINKIRDAYSKRRDAMIEALRTHFEEGTAWTEPEGGLFLWIKLPKGQSASVMFEDALKAGVAYVPGRHFFSEKPDDTTMRLNFCFAGEDDIRTGVKRLAEVIKTAVN
jgi:2-aminoadipate transaminase